MSTNTGVIVLSSMRLNGTDRLDIEDNIGEGIHVHYKNFRLDYSIKEMISIADACRDSLSKLGYAVEMK